MFIIERKLTEQFFFNSDLMQITDLFNCHENILIFIYGNFITLNERILLPYFFFQFSA